MSYCRFGRADAYIFNHVNFGLVCMACALMPITEENDPFPDTFVAGEDIQKMLDHIEDHRDMGNFIPYDVDNRLRKEIKHKEGCPCPRADERGCFLISAKTNKCVSCECEEE